MAAAERRRRLVSDADRVRGYMVAVITDARRAGAQVPVGVTASVEVWRAWADQLRDWTGPDEGEPVGRPDGGPPLLTRPWDWPQEGDDG
jgi:hypothetical protein